MTVRLSLSVLIVTLSFLGSLRAQTTSAEVTGTVSDGSGAVVSQASVTVIDRDTGVKRQAESNNSGNYSIPLLSPGTYSISAQKQGFRTATRTEVSLQVAQVARVDFQLELGNVTESVEVTGQAPLLDQATSSLGQVVDSKQIVDLPLNGRSTFRLVQLTPGITGTPSSNGQFNDIPVNTTDDSIISINGGRAKTNPILIDGVPSTSGFVNQMTYIPSVDATLEFKVESSNLRAEYGRTGGGIINVTTRSGTNQLHGSLFEFDRNTVFDANEFFNKGASQPRPAFHMNQYGFALGGPVLIPKIYNGKNKTFFFTDFQGTRWLQGSTYLTTVPTDAQRAGDFSQTRNQAGALIPIYNPFSTQPDPNHAGSYLRVPFAGNVIPSSMINPISARLDSYFPHANTTGNPITGTNNYISGAPRSIDQANFDIRVDQNISDTEHLFGRFGTLRSTLGQPDYFGNIATPSVGALGKLFLNNFNAVLASTTVLSPSTVLDIRYGFARYYWSRLSRSYGFDQSSLGIPVSLVSQYQVPVFPTVNVSGYSGLAGSSLLLTGQDTHSLLASVSQVVGRNNLKYGIEIHLQRLNDFQLSNGGGVYSFDNTLTAGPNPNNVTANLGNGIASLLLGTPTSGSVNANAGYSLQNFYYAGFIQDDIRASKNLTINVGLRYETESPYTERRNQLNSFNFQLPSPARNAAFPNLTGGLVFATNDNRSVYNWDKNNFSPRFGFAYSPFQKTVIRGGAGLLYSPLTVSNSDTGFSPNSGYGATTTMVATLNGIIPYNTLASPYPGGLLSISRSAQGPATFLGQTPIVWDSNPATPYVVEWNFDVQHQLTSNLRLDAAYTGTRGVKLTQVRSFDALPDSDLSLGTGLQTPVPNPFSGIVSTGPLSTPTIARRQLLLPYPQFTGLNVENDTSGNSIYHAFDLKAEQRFQNGVTFLLAFSASKLISDVPNSISTNDNSNNAGLNTTVQDPNNLRAERSVSELDIPRNLAFNILYELPLGPGKPFLSHSSGLVSRLVGGWQVGGILTYHSGYPLVLTATVTGGGSRPNSTGANANLPTDRSRASEINEWFNTAAFTVPASFTYGNVSRTLPNVRGPALTNLDLTVLKNTRVREQVNVQFRAEAYNSLNDVHLFLPNTNINSVQFGQISSTTGNPRVMQLALKLIF